MPVIHLQSFTFQHRVRNINAKPSVDFDTPQTTRRICPWYPQNRPLTSSPVQPPRTYVFEVSEGHNRKSSEHQTLESDSGVCLSDYRFVFIPADISITRTTASTSRTSSIALRTSSSAPVRHSAGSTRPTSNFYCILFFRVIVQASTHHR